MSVVVTTWQPDIPAYTSILSSCLELERHTVLSVLQTYWAREEGLLEAIDSPTDTTLVMPSAWRRGALAAWPLKRKRVRMSDLICTTKPDCAHRCPRYSVGSKSDGKLPSKCMLSIHLRSMPGIRLPEDDTSVVLSEVSEELDPVLKALLGRANPSPQGFHL